MTTTKPPVLTDEELIALWDRHVGTPCDKYPLGPRDAINFGRAVLARAGADAVREWQPIETAPMDGTEILLFRDADTYEGKPVAARITSGAWIEWTDTASEYHGTTGEYLGQSVQGGGASWMSWDGGFREDAPPTHWMPMPIAPDAIRALKGMPAAATESVLIDGVTYTIPAAVAAELLRLHLDLLTPAAAVADAQVVAWMTDDGRTANAESRAGMHAITQASYCIPLVRAQAQPSGNAGEVAAALHLAEAALADIGDADREPGDDLAWCERRAAEALPAVRAAIAASKGANHGG